MRYQLPSSWYYITHYAQLTRIVAYFLETFIDGHMPRLFWAAGYAPPLFLLAIFRTFSVTTIESSPIDQISGSEKAKVMSYENFEEARAKRAAKEKATADKGKRERGRKRKSPAPEEGSSVPTDNEVLKLVKAPAP